jgi:hypothetical protein
MFHEFHLLFKFLSQTHMINTMNMFYKYDYAYGPNDHCNDPNHARIIKRGCLATFSFKGLYTYNSMRWIYVFTIKYTLEQMVNLHMANEIPSH